MNSVPCPRCGMLVGLEQEVCSHCRTPRDDMEMEEGRALVRNEELRLKQRPKRIAAGVGVFVFLGSAWLLRGIWTAPLNAAWGEFQAEVERIRQPDYWLKGKKSSALLVPVAAAPAAPVRQAPAPAQPILHSPVAVSSYVYLNSSFQPAFSHVPETPAADSTLMNSTEFSSTLPAAAERSLEPVPAEPARAPAERPLNPGELRVKGLVYDLETKQPLANVLVQFEHPNGGGAAVLTDAHGRYSMSLALSSSYGTSVMIEAPGYRNGLLEDRNPPYRERSRQARTNIIAETIDSDLEPVVLRPRTQIVELDLVLVPLRNKN